MSQSDSNSVPPLHRLSHRRILIAEERERRMGAHFEDRFGPEAGDLIRSIRASHAPFLGSSRTESTGSAAGTDWTENPYEVLDRAAKNQARREAAVLAALLDRFGDEVEIEARMSAYDHGWEVGERLAGARGLQGVGPEAAFDLLADHFPWGTACDPGIHLQRVDGTEVVWQSFGKQALDLWNEAGISPHLMSNMNAFWCKGFGESLRGDEGLGLDFRTGRSVADGDDWDEARYRWPEISNG